LALGVALESFFETDFFAVVSETGLSRLFAAATSLI
jgi:hypothetical protein